MIRRIVAELWQNSSYLRSQPVDSGRLQQRLQRLQRDALRGDVGRGEERPQRLLRLGVCRGLERGLGQRA